MQEFTIEGNLASFIMLLVVMMLVVQVYVLLRIRNILQAISMNFDSVLYFCRKYINNQQGPEKAETPKVNKAKTCNFCKHRLAYINTSKANEADESFYYRCGLRNINVSLSDSCVNFERDTSDIKENNDNDSLHE